MNSNKVNHTVIQQLISVLVHQKLKLLLKTNVVNEKMKMDNQLLNSKKRFSSLWRRIIHNKSFEKFSNESHNNVFSVKKTKVTKNHIDDSENCNKENVHNEDLDNENLAAVESCILTTPPHSPCLQTILKKSQTDPSCKHMSTTSQRHATFKDIVKVHEYIIQDSLATEEHYTSEASLTDEDENVHPVRKGFYLDNGVTEEDDVTEDNDQQIVPNFESTYKPSPLTRAEKANIFSNPNNPVDDDDAEDDSDDYKKLITDDKTKKLEQCKASPIIHKKSKKTSNNNINKTKKNKVEELPDDLIFDFACC